MLICSSCKLCFLFSCQFEFLLSVGAMAFILDTGRDSDILLPYVGCSCFFSILPRELEIWRSETPARIGLSYSVASTRGKHASSFDPRLALGSYRPLVVTKGNSWCCWQTPSHISVLSINFTVDWSSFLRIIVLIDVVCNNSRIASVINWKSRRCLVSHATAASAYTNMIHPNKTSQLRCKSATQKTRNTTKNLAPTLSYVLQSSLSQYNDRVLPRRFQHRLSQAYPTPRSDELWVPIMQNLSAMVKRCLKHEKRERISPLHTSNPVCHSA